MAGPEASANKKEETMKTFLMIMVLCFGVLVGSCSLVRPEPVADWVKIEPGGDTNCALDTPYAFWVHRGTVNNLLVYFQGGGACWDATTCAPGSGYYDSSVTAEDSPMNYRFGIFDLNNSKNPFKEYSMLFIPACTGDVHWGDNVKTHQGADGQAFTIYHKGFVNGSTALQWAYANIAAPESVFVTGGSGGGVGSVAFAPYIIQHYSQSKVIQLDDSYAMVFDQPIDLQSEFRAHDNFPDWIPALTEIQPGQFRMADYYAAIANYYADHIFAQYNALHDSTQVSFYMALGGEAGEFEKDFEASLESIHARAQNFRSYTASGNEHEILSLTTFYTKQDDGVLFRDWVADLANNRPVKNVHCVICEVENTAGPENHASQTAISPGGETLINPGDKVGEMTVTTGSGSADIFSFCDPFAKSGVEVRECVVPPVSRLGIGWGNFADSADQLESEWQAQTHELILDGYPVNLAAFGTVDSHIPQGYLRTWNIMVEGLTSGQHELHYVVHEKQPGNEDAVTDVTWIFTVK
jgi:hypothetical protein